MGLEGLIEASAMHGDSPECTKEYDGWHAKDNGPDAKLQNTQPEGVAAQKVHQ